MTVELEQLNLKNGDVINQTHFKTIDNNFSTVQDTINNGELIWQSIINYRNRTNILDSLAKGYITQEQADAILEELII